MNNDPWSQSIEAIQPSTKPKWLTDDIEKKLAAAKYPRNRDGLLMLHKWAKAQLDYFKEEEMMLRKIAVVELVPAKTEGATNVELGNGFKAKIVNNYNYKLDSDNEKIWSCLDKISKVGNRGSFIAERLVSWTPNFLKTEYTTLKEAAESGSEDAKAILAIINAEMLTVTEAAPTLDIIEPKAKKK
jgi:hypothetical protein